MKCVLAFSGACSSVQCYSALLTIQRHLRLEPPSPDFCIESKSTPNMDPVVPTLKVFHAKKSQLSIADEIFFTLQDLCTKFPVRLFVASNPQGHHPTSKWTMAPGSVVRVCTIFYIVRDQNPKANNPVGALESTHFAQMLNERYFEVSLMVGVPVILQRTCLAYRAPFMQRLRTFASKEIKQQVVI